VSDPVAGPGTPDATESDAQGVVVNRPEAGRPDAPRDGGAPEVAPDVTPPPDMGPPAPAGWVGPPLIVAVGQGGRRVVSRDGLTWTGDTQDAMGNADPTKHLNAVAYAAGTLVAVGGGCRGTMCLGRVVTFSGDKWTEATLPPGQSWLAGVAFGNNQWVAAGATGPMVVSPDGKKWTQKGSGPTQVRAIAYGNVGGTNMFVAVGDNALRMRSLDGQTWTDARQGFIGSDEPVSLLSVAIGEGAAVAAGDGGRRIRTVNGVEWADPAAGGMGGLPSVVHSDRNFLAYSSDGVVYVSPDGGRNWMAQTGINAPSHSVATGLVGGVRIFVGARGGIIKTSGNGVAWTDRLSTAGANTLAAFGFAGY
jgi:hypothetical protein